MSSPSRLQAALPAIVTFVFGLAFGLVAGRIVWGTSQPSAAGGMQAMGGEQQGMAAEEMPMGMPDEDQLRQALVQHEQLLEKSPEDIGLIRSIGNYYSMLNDNDKALELYARAMELARKQGNQEAVLELYVDEGISLVEKGDIPGGLKRLEECSALDPKDVRSRLTRVAVYLQRVLPAPPPGMDRKQAIASAETILDEVAVLDPENEYAAQFRSMISAVRSSMGRPREDAAGAAATGEPATAAPGP